MWSIVSILICYKNKSANEQCQDSCPVDDFRIRDVIDQSAVEDQNDFDQDCGQKWYHKAGKQSMEDLHIYKYKSLAEHY